MLTRSYVIEKNLPSVVSIVVVLVGSVGSKLETVDVGLQSWPIFKVIHPKYSKHCPYTVAHTIDYVCSKILDHGLNHGLFLSLFKLIPCPIHWIVYGLAYSNFIFAF